MIDGPDIYIPYIPGAFMFYFYGHGGSRGTIVYTTCSLDAINSDCCLLLLNVNVYSSNRYMYNSIVCCCCHFVSLC